MIELIFVGVLAVFLFVTVIAVMRRYKRCPSNKILVKFGKVGKGRSAVPIHGGATFIWPLFQNYGFLDLTPLTIDIALKGALSKQNIRMDVPSRFTIGISTEYEGMVAAAERLLGLGTPQIEELARDIIFGQLRATIATMDIEEINTDREGFETKVMNNIESELKKIGLKFINVNITDIRDESGYIEALGQQAAAQAINKAKVQVAQADRDGATGSAEAKQQERIIVSAKNAEAVQGENEARAKIAQSEAELREKEAEAKRRGDAADSVKKAEANREGYQASREAEMARAEMEQARQTADVVVSAQIEKQRQVIAAEAAKEQATLAGQAEGEATRAKMEGEAFGLLALLEKKAEGLKKIVEASGSDPNHAAVLMIVEQLPEIAKLQAQAISNISFDKIVVMDSGSSDGSSTTATWLAGMVKSLPALHEVAEMAGLNLPASLGSILAEKSPQGDKTRPAVAGNPAAGSLTDQGD